MTSDLFGALIILLLFAAGFVAAANHEAKWSHHWHKRSRR